MSVPKFVWIIRAWCSVDTFWEHVREHKEYDIAYTRPEMVLEEIERIILKEQSDWRDICEASNNSDANKEFIVEKPSIDQLKIRPFFKFMTVSHTKEDFMQSWYIERLKVADTN